MKISDKVKDNIGLFLLCVILCVAIAGALLSLVGFIQRPAFLSFLSLFSWIAGVYVWFDLVIKEVKLQGWKEGYREASDKWIKYKEEDNEAWVTALQESSTRWRNFCDELVKKLESNHERK
jgi:hypothetical protein